jgi:hypothetical protein
MISHAVDHTGYSSSSDLQYKLFDGDVAIDPVPQQQSVREPSTYLEKRKAARSRAFAKADPVVLVRYRECLRLVGKAMPTFGAWDVTSVFEQKFGELDTTGKKALGALFLVLQHEGVIEEAGFGRRKNGNVANLYRLKNGK